MTLGGGGADEPIAVLAAEASPHPVARPRGDHHAVSGTVRRPLAPRCTHQHAHIHSTWRAKNKWLMETIKKKNKWLIDTFKKDEQVVIETIEK